MGASGKPATSIRRCCLYPLLGTVFLLILRIDTSHGQRNSAQRLRGFTVSSNLGETDYEVMRSWKANVVRFHLHWGDIADSSSSSQYLEWLDSELPKLDQALEWAASHDMKVIVNLHTPPGGFKSAAFPSLHRMFAEQWALNTFYAAWERIASRYAGNDTIWGYDILNEPALRSPSTAIASWESIAQATATLIHMIDPDRKIIVEPLYGDQARMWSIRRLKFPNLVVSIHYYYPLRFHHQGIYGNKLGVEYPKRSFNRAALVRNLQTITQYQRKTKGRIPIYVGEFTANRWAPKNSAFNFLRDIINLMEQRRWSWTYHAFREADPWNLELEGLAEQGRKTKHPTKRELLVKKFLARNRF